MKRTLTLVALLTLVLACGAGCGAPPPVQEEQPAAPSKPQAAHWGYEADNGPAVWGEMNEAWSMCATGRSQSPIDLGGAGSGDTSATSTDFPEAALHVVQQEQDLEAVNNGHSIQVNYDGGETLTFGDQSFRLLQFHFHSPSEHTVGGEHYPMEMHLVHKEDAGNLAVIGVFIEEGEHNEALDAVWQNMPQEKDFKVHLEGVQVDVDDMLPEGRSSYRYHGSLTTPPCSEGVRWIVMTDPIQLGQAQIDAFRNLYTGNNRPPQPLNGRDVLTDRIQG